MAAAIQLVTLLLVLSSVFGWINKVYIGLPHAIGLLIMGILASVTAILVDVLIPGSTLAFDLHAEIAKIDFFDTLINGMLSFLLFAAALHVDVRVLSHQKLPIILLATIGVLISTAIVGSGIWLIAGLFGQDFPFVWALVFGALISPTDPVAVLSVMKTVKVTRSLQAKIAGESLFNDGMGVIAFTVLLAIAMASTGMGTTAAGEHLTDQAGNIEAFAIGKVFVVEVFGAIALGILTGGTALFMIHKIDDAALETLISLTLVFATYVVATSFHLSGPIAAVVPGLIIGNWGTKRMSERTRTHLFPFWDMIDEILNSVLFLLIGLELLVVDFGFAHVVVAFLCIPLVLAARFVSVAIPITVLRGIGMKFGFGSIRVMTWGGVRGGISVALALSLPEGPYKDLILNATYVVVVFSIVVQGLTVAPLIRNMSGLELRRFGNRIGAPVVGQTGERQIVG
jgi:CPA1 family monovalent cation:H+ antiporter